MNDRTIIRPGGRRNREVIPDKNSDLTGKSNIRRTNLASLAREQSAISHDRKIFKYVESRSEPDNYSFLGSNVLLTTLAPIILLTSKVKSSTDHINIDELRTNIQEQIEYCQSINFGMDGHKFASEEISYGLCCLLDDMVLNTPWGSKSSWSNESLLVTFHKEAWGGNRFFDYLETMMLNPSKYLDVIELYYIFLELGFEGKYRLQSDGLRELNSLKTNTFLIIEKYRNLEVQPLSDKWESKASYSNYLLRTIPQWVIWSICIFLLVSIYFWFAIKLSNTTDPIKRKLVVLAEIDAMEIIKNHNLAPDNSNVENINSTSEKIKLLSSSLSSDLSYEISKNLLLVEQKSDGVLIRLTNSNLFKSGSDSLANQYVTIVKKIAN